MLAIHLSAGLPRMASPDAGQFFMRPVEILEWNGFVVLGSERSAAKENPPRKVAASFPGPDLLHAFRSVGHCDHVS